MFEPFFMRLDEFVGADDEGALSLSPIDDMATSIVNSQSDNPTLIVCLSSSCNQNQWAELGTFGIFLFFQ